MIEIAAEHGMTVRPCGEGDELSVYGADCSGCMTEQIYEQAVHTSMDFPKITSFERNVPACWALTSELIIPACICAGIVMQIMMRIR